MKLNKKLSILISITGILLPTTINSMTCILIYYHNNSLIIGSDCLASTPTGHFDGDGNRIYNKTSTCKILKVNDIYLTGSGKQMDLIIGSIQNYFQKNIDHPDLLSYLFENLKPTLEKRLDDLKKIDPTHYNETYEGFMFNRIAVIQFNNDLPDINIVAFSAKTEERNQISIDIFYQDPPPLSSRNDLMIPFGRYETIRNMYLNPIYWEDKSAVDGIENLLEIQAKATPDEVGGPMSIVTLTKEGYHWNRKGNCSF